MPVCRGHSRPKNNMKIFTLYFLSMGILAISCQGPGIGSKDEKIKHTDSIVNNERAVAVKGMDSLSLDHFMKVPDDIEGCSCYFSGTEEKFNSNEYLFVANFDSIAYISIGKKLLKLKLIFTGRKRNTFGDKDHVDVYSNNNYKITVVIKYKKSTGAETWRNSGTITVERLDGRKIVKNFVGECGC
jgi:hypothetical protein